MLFCICDNMVSLRTFFQLSSSSLVKIVHIIPFIKKWISSLNWGLVHSVIHWTFKKDDLKERRTSENVKEALFSLLWLAGEIAAIADLQFMANGTTTNDMAKEGTFIEYDNCRILSVRGSPRKVIITIPRITCNKDLIKVHTDESSCTTLSFTIWNSRGNKEKIYIT